MNRHSPDSAQVDTPLIIKRNPKVILSKLITAMTHELKDYVVKSDSRVRRQFFGVDHNKDYVLDKKKIVEKVLVQLRQVNRTIVNSPLNDGIKQILSILLAAKLDALTLYTNKGEKPVILDRTLDNCIGLCQKQVNRLKNEPDLVSLFESLLRQNQIEATQAIYKQYDQKLISLSARVTDEKTLEKVSAFHQELVTSSQDFAARSAGHFTEQPREDFLILLREERHQMMSLEPLTDHFETPELHKLYQWAIKAVSKLAGYIKSLDEQMSIQSWRPDLEGALKKP